MRPIRVLLFILVPLAFFVALLPATYLFQYLQPLLKDHPTLGALVSVGLVACALLVLWPLVAGAIALSLWALDLKGRKPVGAYGVSATEAGKSMRVGVLGCMGDLDPETLEQEPATGETFEKYCHWGPGREHALRLIP